MIQPKKKTRKKRESLDTLYDKRNRALERVVALWEKDQDVNHALDVLTLAHAAATFEFVGGE
jgi:uncharacterized coiled-coil DUF342 family protein